MLFRKIKDNVETWLKDEIYIDAKKEKVFPDFIKASDEIEAIWTSEPGYTKTYSDVMLAQVKAGNTQNAATKKALEEAMQLLNSIKKMLISQNSERIYSLAAIIRGLQRLYPDLWPYIGEPVDLDKTLGPQGSKLKNKDIAALLYIDELIERGENLKVELTNVSANKMRREANQIFRR